MPSPAMTRSIKSLSRDELAAYVADNLANCFEEEALAILENRYVTPQICQQIARSQRLTAFYSVRLRLVALRQTPQAHAVKLIHYLYWFDLLRLSVDVKVPPTVRRAIDQLLLTHVNKLTVGERVSSARRCNGTLAKALMFDPELSVFEALLTNPRLRGEELRREREIRGISLKEIADATKISKRFLDAIERNDHRTLPAPVFTRGFVREYAKYLGLNADEMVNRYNYAAAGDDRIEKSAHLERLVAPPPPPVKEKPFRISGIPPWYARIDRNVIVTGVIIIALAVLGYWAVRHKREISAAAREEAQTVTTATTHPAPKAAATATTASMPPAAASSAPDATLRLVVEASARSWIVLEADGKTVFNDEMRKGDRATYEI